MTRNNTSQSSICWEGYWQKALISLTRTDCFGKYFQSTRRRSSRRRLLSANAEVFFSRSLVLSFVLSLCATAQSTVSVADFGAQPDAISRHNSAGRRPAITKCDGFAPEYGRSTAPGIYGAGNLRCSPRFSPANGPSRSTLPSRPLCPVTPVPGHARSAHPTDRGDGAAAIGPGRTREFWHA